MIQEKDIFQSKVFLKNAKIGKVILTSSGSPESITLKTFRYMRNADIVLTDRLVSQDILKYYLNPASLVIHVGKECGNKKSISQTYINDLMVVYALKGKLVLRVKGGDVSIFSNIIAELDVLLQCHIPYEIIPGVTSASVSSACLGIPLTARGYSSGVRLLTYYNYNLIQDFQWKDLAETDDTLVFYMVKNIDKLIKYLLKYGISRGKKLAIIEQAGTPSQYIRTKDLFAYRKLKKKKRTPYLIIIGRVVKFHRYFKWFSNNSSIKENFLSFN
jgi:siroheme synthase